MDSGRMLIMEAHYVTGKQHFILTLLMGPWLQDQLALPEASFKGALCPHFSFALHWLPPPPRPSTLLNESSHGYEINGQKVTHLFYTNDLKTYARDDKHQTCLLKIFKIFRDGIHS